MFGIHRYLGSIGARTATSARRPARSWHDNEGHCSRRPFIIARTGCPRSHGIEQRPQCPAAATLQAALVLASFVLTIAFVPGALAATNAPGLLVTFTALEGGSTPGTDAVVSPNFWLYVPAGKPPTPFLAGGKFSAVWNGYVSVDLRSEYQFQAELNGRLKLEVNGATALEVSGTGSTNAPSKPIRLNKGANTIIARFDSPAQGDAFVRLAWFNEEVPVGPIPLAALSHPADTPEETQSVRLRLGRELVIEHRCLKCHAGPRDGVPELAMDAPAFDGIGSRRNYDWMRRWILDPKGQRPAAHMPRLFHGTKAKDDADAIAAYLASLQEGAPAAPKARSADFAEAGKKLFDALHCIACHTAPDSKEADQKKISLKQVRAKFAPGMLEEFLRRPEAHYSWIRMPNFKLSAEEADGMAAFLNSIADKAEGVSAPTDSATLDRGRKLSQTSGCLSCHNLKLENQFTARPWTELPASRWEQGCLAAQASETSKAPYFAFTTDVREALQAFAQTDRASLMRHAPAEFAERQARSLNCRECHGKFDGFPPLEILGGKLKPEWSRSFIAGEIKYKPRSWLDARMPAFASRAESLAYGLAMLHGYPPQTPAEPPLDPEAARVGQKLVSSDGGFSCIACHAAGSFAATAVFESAGINLAYSGERILGAYFQRWVTNPLQIDPQTKMPVYFEKGRSPLSEIYDGDADKQIHAIWQYIRLGEKMPPPASQ